MNSTIDVEAIGSAIGKIIENKCTKVSFVK